MIIGPGPDNHLCNNLSVMNLSGPVSQPIITNELLGAYISSELGRISEDALLEREIFRMNGDIKTCIYCESVDDAYTSQLRTSLDRHAAIHIVTEANDKAGLADCLERLPISLLVVDLDPEPSSALQVVEDISARFPALAIVALSAKPDPELILSAMRSGCRQFIPKPIDLQDLTKALKLLTRSAGDEQAKTERTICLIGSSGGCGVTTIAANLAIEMAQLAGEPCALVDLQLEFGSVATYFDSRPAHTIADLTNSSSEIDTHIVEQAMTVLPSNVALLARPERVDQAANVNPESIARILKVLAQRYDSVLVDTPCRFDGISIAALEMASSVMLVLQLSVPSIRNAQRLYKPLIQYGMPAEKILPVVNRSTRNSPVLPQDVEEHLGTSVFAVIPNDYKTVQGALDFGRPLLNESPDSPVRKAIAQIARRLHKGDFSTTSSAVQAKRKAGFFSRWLGS